jgi:hypothetical protein
MSRRQGERVLYGTQVAESGQCVIVASHCSSLVVSFGALRPAGNSCPGRRGRPDLIAAEAYAIQGTSSQCLLLERREFELPVLFPVPFSGKAHFARDFNASETNQRSILRSDERERP